MGRKRGTKRKHLLLYGACVFIFLLVGAGCAVTSSIQKRWESQGHLDRAEKRIRKGDYQGALNADEKVIKLFPAKPPGDRALFHMGLIWVHADNPGRNYEKALACFQGVVRNYPGSELSAEAEAWADTIEDLIGCRKKRRALQQQLDTLKEIDIRTEEKKREE